MKHTNSLSSIRRIRPIKRSPSQAVITREEFIYNCASISEDSTNKSIDVIIGRIRGKLGDDPKEPKYIHAIRGIGYKLMQ